MRDKGGMALRRALRPLLLLQAARAAPYTEENKAYNMNNNVSARNDARFYGWVEPDPSRTYFPSPEDWTRHAVYQVVVDRFFDGDPRNNAQHDGLIFDWRRNEGPLDGFDVRDLSTRQGGDWRGLAMKLDYILGMGCRALWISPVQQNQPNSPMGYLGIDKTLLERRFGNLTDFKHLVAEAHARGMYIVVDVVNNHLGEFLDWVSESDEDKTVQFTMHTGGPASSPNHPDRPAEPKIRPKMKVLEACRQTAGCDPETYQPYVDFPYDNTWYPDGKYPGMTYREAGFIGLPLGVPDNNGTGGYWGCNFHHSGEMPVSEEGPWDWTLGKLYGTLDDIRTTEDVVVDKLIAASVSIINALDIDGFRLDTPREVAYTLWPRWRAEVDKAARKVGKTNFGTWGELWSTPERAATYMGRGKDIPMYFYEGDNERSQFINPDGPIFDGLINYNYFYWIVTVFRVGRVDQSYMAFNILEWESTLGYDIQWPSFPTDGTDKIPRYQMWNFCGSHDQHRMTQFPMGAERLRLCQAWVFTWPGIPVTYQGDEQGLLTPGSGLAYWGREFMGASVAWSTIPTVEGPDGTLRNPADADNFDQGSNYYRLYRRLTNLRDLWWDEAFSCLGDGANGSGIPQRIECTSAEDGSLLYGVFSYRRSCRPHDWGVVMLMNLEDATHSVVCGGMFTARKPAQVLNAMHQAGGPGSAFEYQVVADVRRITLRPFEIQALVPEQRAFKLQVDSVSPRHESALSLDAWRRQRVTIVFTDPVDPASLVVEIGGQVVQATLAAEDARLAVVDMASPGLPASVLGEGIRIIRVVAAKTADGGRGLPAPYTFRVRVGPPGNPLVTRPMRVDHDIISIQADGTADLVHKAVGAEYFRMQHAGSQGAWDRASAWIPLDGSPRVPIPGFTAGLPLVVQYYVDGSAAYLVTGCRVSATETCYASYYSKGAGKDVMSFKGDLNQWLEIPAWSFDPPRPETGDHNWTIDLHISLADSPFLIDVAGDLGHMVGAGNDVTNPFFFPFENYCWGRLTNRAPHGKPFEGCAAPLLGPLAGIKDDLCACDMTPQTLFLYDSGVNHTHKWMMERHPDYWRRTDAWGREVYHGSTQYVADPSSGLYNLRVPSGVCPLYSACRVTFNDLEMTFTIGLSPPGVTGLGKGRLTTSLAAGALWVLVPFVAAAWVSRRKRRDSVVVVVVPDRACGARAGRWSRTLRLSGLSSASLSCPEPARRRLQPKQVLVASLEYIIPTQSGVQKAVAGGLGKVAGLLCEYHPGTLISVHACMPGKSYDFATVDEPIQAVVSGRRLTCKVYKYELEGDAPASQDVAEGAILPAPKVTFYIIDHPIFRERTDIYPIPQTSRSTIEFYALWNQVVAKMVDRVRPHVFQVPDFHAAMSVMYLERPVPVVVVLHNAEYQGAIATQHMGRREAQWFGDIFNLPAERIRQEAFEDGKFTMLKPVVDFVRRHQRGYGICAVSRNYALEAAQKHSVLWGLPEVRGIENCMPETERLAFAHGHAPGSPAEEAFLERRRQAKLFVQRAYSLKEDVNARIFVFVGRWVKQKGVDYIADITEWMLSTYKDAQLIMIGPIGDPYGTYAKEKMEALKKGGRFANSLFVHAGFLQVPAELKLACDFCLMPSRDEPFGYVDIEFAWFGAVVVGSLRGGLGKLPGFYFQILNSDSSVHMQRHFMKAVSKAMSCDQALLSRMSQIARSSTFPVEEWQQETLRIYDQVLRSFDVEAAARPQELHEQPPPEALAAAAPPALEAAKRPSEPQCVAFPDDVKGLRDDNGSDSEESESVRSLPLQRHPPYPDSPVSNSAGAESPRSFAGSGHEPRNDTCRSDAHHTCRSAHSSISVVEIETERDMAGAGDGVGCDKGGKPGGEGGEFLRQEASEAEIRAHVEAKLHGQKAPPNASALLEEVEWRLQLETESGAWVTQLLGSRILDVPLLDWIIALSYLSGPLVAALPISTFSGASSLALFVVDPLVQACSLIMWTALARWTQPNLLMAAASLSRLVLLVLPLVTSSAMTSAVAVGLIVPADYIFIYYCFMGSSVGDVARLAVRTGIMMAVREYWTWLFLGFKFSSGFQRGLITVGFASVFSVMPAFALINAPKLYREFRLPTIQFGWVRKLRFLGLLGLASIVQSLSRVSESALLVMRQTSPFDLEYRHAYCLALGVAGLVPLVMLALMLWRLPSYAMSIVKAFACFSMPAVLLRSWAQYEIDQSVELAFLLDGLIFLSTMLGALSVYAIAVAVLATVGSRWRFVSYTCCIGVLSNLARMASFVILRLYTQQPDPFKARYLPQTLAWHVFVVALPPCAVALALRIAAFFFFDQEATGMLRTAQQRRLVQFARSSSSLMLEEEALRTASELAFGSSVALDVVPEAEVASAAKADGVHAGSFQATC